MSVLLIPKTAAVAVHNAPILEPSCVSLDLRISRFRQPRAASTSPFNDFPTAFSAPGTRAGDTVSSRPLDRIFATAGN